MKSQSIKMTIDEFWQIKRKLGWKYEYSDNQAFISPNSAVVFTQLKIKPTKYIESFFKIQSLTTDYIDELSNLYYLSFRESFDFCDWEDNKISDAAINDIKRYFNGELGVSTSYSKIVIDNSTNMLIGACFITKKKAGYFNNEMLFIHPDFQSKGIAKALLNFIGNDLLADNIKYLRSAYFLGNSISREWHYKMGFEIIYDLVSAKHHSVFYQYELNRLKNMNNVSSNEFLHIKTQYNFWNNKLAELEVIAEQEGIESVLPQYG